MARSEKQKEKLFRIIEILMRETDEEYGLSINAIISRLEEYGISAERKSIYDDFAVLEKLGFPVLKLSGKPPTYTLEERVFELPELKLLVDAVQSSRFITAKKSRELILKLELFAGSRRARELSRQVYVEDRVKTENKAVIYSVDCIHSAINSNRRLSFRYFDYNGSKEQIFRHNGALYEVSPCALIWSDENYYLVAHEQSSGIMKNFRVDKMTDVKVSQELRADIDEVKRFNQADYSKKIFGMYGGREELCTLEFEESLAGVVIDRFGIQTRFVKTDFGFRIAERVIISPTFYAWILGFGDKVKIVSPEPVQRELLEILKKTTKLYKTEIQK